MLNLTSKNEARLFTRRTLIAATLAALPFPAPAQNGGPDALIAAIYKRVSSGKGEDGGGFVWVNEKDRARYLTRSLRKVWHDSDARTAKGDQTPPGFDPITNSQDPKVRDVKVAIETQGAERAIVAVSFRGWGGPDQRETIRYDMLRENGRWLIDDIRATIDGKEWSLRALLSAHTG
jgi:hypothetical protein